MIRCLLITFCLLYGFMAKGQYVEFGAMGGATSYMGDLVPPEQFFKTRNLGGQLLVAYNFTPRLAVQLNFLTGTVAGDDVNSTYASGRRQRNLHFKSSVRELSVVGRFSLLPYKPRRLALPVSPYGFAGIAVFGFDPMALYKGEWVALQPLGTEGQGLDGYAAPYHRVGLAIPVGAGIKWALSRRVHFMLEFGLRKTFTDYLDDVSGDYVKLSELKQQASDLTVALSNRTLDKYGNQIEMYGNPRGHAGKDWYAFFGAGLVYSLQKGTGFKGRR